MEQLQHTIILTKDYQPFTPAATKPAKATGDKQRKPSTANRKDNSDTESVGVVKNVGTKGEKNTAKGGKNTAKGGKNTAKGGKNTVTDQKGPGIDKPIW